MASSVCLSRLGGGVLSAGSGGAARSEKAIPQEPTQPPLLLSGWGTPSSQGPVWRDAWPLSMRFAHPLANPLQEGSVSPALAATPKGFEGLGNPCRNPPKSPSAERNPEGQATTGCQQVPAQPLHPPPPPSWIAVAPQPTQCLGSLCRGQQGTFMGKERQWKPLMVASTLGKLSEPPPLCQASLPFTQKGPQRDREGSRSGAGPARQTLLLTPSLN